MQKLYDQIFRCLFKHNLLTLHFIRWVLNQAKWANYPTWHCISSRIVKLEMIDLCGIWQMSLCSKDNNNTYLLLRMVFFLTLLPIEMCKKVFWMTTSNKFIKIWYINKFIEGPLLGPMYLHVSGAMMKNCSSKIIAVVRNSVLCNSFCHKIFSIYTLRYWRVL